ncbi:MAG: lipoyl(octanoyl) transferase LipB [Nitrospirae bacterium]|nr:lipoyl(octanoyl) transferase LipB [Nitrospirota bacterium]
MVEYGRAWSLQKRLFDERLNNKMPDVLIIIEHPPTYTFGRRSIMKQREFSEDIREAASFDVDRGGGATYHGPGQLVAYPILGLRSYTQDYHNYLRMLEEVIILTLEDFGIMAERARNFTGVWVDGKKISSIGVRIIKGITMHGLSLNINNDLTPFNRIIPCNIHGVEITSMSEIAGTELSMLEVEENFVDNFSSVFEVEMGEFMMYNIPPEHQIGGFFNAFGFS